jgi:ribose 5-phosphate isomerase B
MAKKKLITEKDILNVIYKGKRKFEITGNELFTPAAKDKITEAGIKLVKASQNSSGEYSQIAGPFYRYKKVAVGGDHTGFSTKKIIIKFLIDQGYEVVDVGTYDENSCDYPDYAIKVSELVKNGEVYFGILFDATGIPSAITANKLKGIRAATCYNEFSARSAREHNNANIIVLGAKTLGEETIKSILNVWLNSKFLGERHQRRLEKINQLEK